MTPTSLPSLAPFPEARWRDRIVPEEWEACLSMWVRLAEAHLSLPDTESVQVSAKDESLKTFLVSFTKEMSKSGITLLGSSPSAPVLLRYCFRLISELLRLADPPPSLLQWDFLSDFAKVFGKRCTAPVLASALKKPAAQMSLTTLKKSLILALEAGIKGDLSVPEARLRQLNHLLHASPDAAVLVLAGSDFVDGLIGCYKVMNPPLRKTIIATAYLCLIGLTGGEAPNYSMLTDQLYSLQVAANAHKAGPTSGDDSMVAELVTVTPILKQVRTRLETSSLTMTRVRSVITQLEAFRKPGGRLKPKRLVKRKIDKGKGLMRPGDDEDLGQMKMHRMSQISQIQDLFPDLGSEFLSKLLDEYGENTEQVISHLLEESLPPHLAQADRTKNLYAVPPLFVSGDADRHSSAELSKRRRSSLIPRATPPQLPVRHNVFDGDELDQLTVDVSKLHFGKRDPDKTADDLLKDRSTAPNRAAILSALSAFDADDDERDDTYDAADAGLAAPDALADDADEQRRGDVTEEILFKAYQSDPKLFDRDSDTRRGNYRASLKRDTGMTDEAIEGWALMLGRNPGQMRSLEAKYSAAAFTGTQPALAPTAWRASPAASGAEEEPAGTDGGGRGRDGSRGRGTGRGAGRGGRGRGNVAGPTGEKGTDKARKHKEANKGSTANHNRRDGRARKMARAGFPG